MEIKTKEAYGIVSTNICDLNNYEMHQMNEMKERIAQVLASHKNEKTKNEYLTDDELEMIHVIFHVFTKEYSSAHTSVFDDALKELNKPAVEEADKPEQPAPEIPS